METNKLEKSIQEIFDGQYKYIVPLYQRNFAWRRDEIEQLLQDIYEAYKTNKDSFYYIGSLIVLKRANGDFEVIDGQQRLTALSLITKILKINDKPRLFYDSRPEVEEFFREFYDSGACTINYPQTFHLKNAINYMKEASLDASGKEDLKISEDTSEIIEFKKYFANNVFLVMVEIPQDTDVASYFEIMNNRGEQLQKHEILKSFLLSELSKTNKNKTKEFARIWDACSQMDIPIQKLFDAGTRKCYFDEDYAGFCFKELMEGTYTTQEPTTISMILSTQVITQAANNNNEDEQDADESIYKSIIDFPNFLMHVFKVMFQDETHEIPLNEKYLLSTYKKLKLENKIDPEKFIWTLFFCRTVFDRYIIKTISDKTDTEDGERWTLRKPKKHENSWNFVDTFGKGDNKSTSNEQSRIIKALSMLQVTFRTRMYKNWLYEILKWFVHEKKMTFNVSYDDYIKKLDDIILSNYKPIGFQVLNEEIALTKDNSYSLGTKTPHFVLNFIDYLYWVKAKTENDNRIVDFDFKYWNSIEHHMAREWAERNTIKDKEDFIDNLGNLCLISKSSNSRLSDRDVKEKVETFGKGNLGAKRQIMYKMTKERGYLWNKEQIKEHYNELIELLKNREAILDHNSEAINCLGSNKDTDIIDEVDQSNCHALCNSQSVEMYPKEKYEESISTHDHIKQLMQNIDASGFRQWLYCGRTLVHELYLNYDGKTFIKQPWENSLCCDSVFHEDGTISVLLFLRKNTKEATSKMFQDAIWKDYQFLEITENGRCEIKTFNKTDNDETIINYFERNLFPKMKQWREEHKEEYRINRNS